MAKRRKTVASFPTETEKAEEKGVGGGKTQKRRPGRQGALRYIKDIPLDVLFEIFAYLDPIDILRLSRTSRSLRKILLSRSSTCVWKAARNNIGVPDRIPSMSEPAFANLLSDPHCHFCFTATVHSIAWFARVRCCKKCLPIYFASAFELQNDGLLTEMTVSNSLWKVLPRYCLDNSCGQRQWRKLDEVYLISAAEELADHVSCLDTEESAEWLEDWIETALLDLAHSILCQNWMEQRTTKRGQELSDVRQLRFNAIISKLEDIGWGHELTFERGREELKEHKLVKQPKPLTDRIWQNIGQILVGFMETVKVDRLKREHKALCEKRYKLLVDILQEREATLPDELVMPPSVDIACWEPFNSIIEDLPAEIETEGSMFDDALEQLPQFIQDWNCGRNKVLLAALQAHSPEAIAADLHLATSLFRCQHRFCMTHRVASYPAILSHQGFQAFWVSGKELRPWLSHSAKVSTDCELKLHESGAEISRNVMRLCALDTTTTTSEEMLTLNPLVECKDCATESGIRIFMRWSRALTHDSHKEIPEFALPSEEERSIIEQHEAVYHEPSYWHESKPWYRCKQCQFRGKKEDVKAHLTNLHGVENPVEADWTYRFMGYLNQEGAQPVRIVPRRVKITAREDVDFATWDLHI